MLWAADLDAGVGRTVTALTLLACSSSKPHQLDPSSNKVLLSPPASRIQIMPHVHLELFLQISYLHKTYVSFVLYRLSIPRIRLRKNVLICRTDLIL